MNPDSKRPVSLEDLLRLKRAERPPAEFWDRFERELRAKQLSALVEKRPWWRSLSFARLARYQLPLGATAILAVTFITVRHYQSTPSSPAVRGDVAAAMRLVAGVRPESAVARAIADEQSAASLVRAEAVELAAADEPSFNAIATVLEGHSRSMPSSSDGSANVELAQAKSASSTHSFATAHLVSTQGAEFAVSSTLLGTTRGFESRAMPARTPVVEPLAQMSSPADVRRSRLLTAVVAAASFAPPARVNDEASRGLSDDRLYDSVRRFGARGDRLLVKF